MNCCTKLLLCVQSRQQNRQTEAKFYLPMNAFATTHKHTLSWEHRVGVGRIQFNLTLTAERGLVGWWGIEGWMECKKWSDGRGQMPVADTWDKLDDLELMEMNRRTTERSEMETSVHIKLDDRHTTKDQGNLTCTWVCSWCCVSQPFTASLKMEK